MLLRKLPNTKPQRKEARPATVPTPNAQDALIVWSAACDGLWRQRHRCEKLAGRIACSDPEQGAGATSPQVEAVLSPYLLALQISPKVAFAPLFVM